MGWISRDWGVGGKLVEWPGVEGAAQWHKEWSGASKQMCTSGVNTGYSRVQHLISDLDVGAECTLSKFSDDTKLWRIVDMPADHATIQKNLDRLEICFDKTFMKFNKEKYKDLHLGWNNTMHKYMLGATQSHPAGKQHFRKGPSESWWTPSWT